MTLSRIALLVTAVGLVWLSAVALLAAAEKCGCGTTGGQQRSAYNAGQSVNADARAKELADRDKKARMIQSLIRGDQKSDLHEAQLTLADSGKSRTVPLGYPIYVRLSGNPSSGLEWRVAELNGGTVRQSGKPVFYPRETGREHGGIAGSYVFKFEAVKQGRSTLKMVYQKPGDKRHANLFTATIEVATRSLGSDSKATDVKVKGVPARTSKAAANVRDQAQSNGKP